MSFTVKAYLHRDAEQILLDRQPEIRRFGVDDGQVTNYDYLERRVMTIFPNLTGKSLKMFWKDSENELIAFSSDDELSVAMASIDQMENVFKIHIVSGGGGHKGSDQTDSSRSQSEVWIHHGVSCDVCEMSPIRGLRYKCMQCRDYDLCKTCENAGKHGDHMMLRVSKPTSLGPGPMPFVFGFGGLGNGFGGPGRGPRGGLFGRGGPFGRGCPRGGPFGPWGPDRGHPHHAPHPHHTPHHHGSEDQKTFEEPNSAETGEKQQQTTNFSSDDFLRSIGEQVAAFFDPLGIDCEVNVENKDGSRHRCGPNKEEEPAPNNLDIGTSTATPLVEPFPLIPEATTGMMEREHIGEETENEGILRYVVETSSRDSAGTKGQSWPTTEPGMSDYQPVRQVVSDPYERGLAPNIVNALNQMRSMGFGNDGGWLTALLASKDGDIDATLESLKPNFHNSPCNNGDRMG